jgi:hypothetical protein
MMLPSSVFAAKEPVLLLSELITQAQRPLSAASLEGMGKDQRDDRLAQRFYRLFSAAGASDVCARNITGMVLQMANTEALKLLQPADLFAGRAALLEKVREERVLDRYRLEFPTATELMVKPSPSRGTNASACASDAVKEKPAHDAVKEKPTRDSVKEEPAPSRRSLRSAKERQCVVKKQVVPLSLHPRPVHVARHPALTRPCTVCRRSVCWKMLPSVPDTWRPRPKCRWPMGRRWRRRRSCSCRRRRGECGRGWKPPKMAKGGTWRRRRRRPHRARTPLQNCAATPAARARAAAPAAVWPMRRMQSSRRPAVRNCAAVMPAVLSCAATVAAWLRCRSRRCAQTLTFWFRVACPQPPSDPNNL